MESKIQIVDENDQVISHKDRSEVDYQNDIYRVAALWVTNSQGQVLIAQRKLTKDKDPGKWGPAVSGTVDEGETYEANIYKEAEEEIGLTGAQFNKGPKMRVSQPRNYFCQWFTLSVDRDIGLFHVQEEEVEELRWVLETELARDVRENPILYVPVMPKWVETFIKSDRQREPQG